MRFDPLSETEIQTASLLPDGIYAYEVIKSEEKTSKAGNDYISLNLKVWDSNGAEHIVYTNLALIKLLKHFCDVNNLQNEYSSGEISAGQCFGKSGGMVIVGIEGEKPNPNGGTYKAKNIVKDYVVKPESSKLTPLAPRDAFDDEIPF